VDEGGGEGFDLVAVRVGVHFVWVPFFVCDLLWC
jgi:hypothetical protein